MSLVVERSPSSSATTATSTTAADPLEEDGLFSPFAFPESPSSTSALPNLENQQYTPVKLLHDHLLLVRSGCSNRRSSDAPFFRLTTPTKRLSCDVVYGDSDSEHSGPVKKAGTKLFGEADALALFDSNSRDSGFESEASRLSYSLSTGSNPGTPSSSTSGLSVVTGVSSLIGQNSDDHLLGVSEAAAQEGHSKSPPLCLWEDCNDPDLSLEEADNRTNLLAHLLSRHIQPLELEPKEKDRISLYKCLWRGCKVYGKGSKLYSWLEGHVVERHAGPRPFLCPLPGCSQRFGSKVLAERHINSHFANDDHVYSSKGKPSTRMTLSGTSKRPSPLAISPRSSKQHLASPRSTDISSVKRKLLDVEEGNASRQYHTSNCKRTVVPEPPPKRRRRQIVPKKQQQHRQKANLNGLVGERGKSSSTSHGGIKSRLRVKQQPETVSFTTSSSRSIPHHLRDDGEEKQKRKAANTARSGGKRALVTCSVDAALCKAVGKDKLAVLSTTITTKVASNALEKARTNTSSTGAIQSGVKRKAARVKNVPEDAFDAMYSRAMHVLAARCVIASTKKRDMTKKRTASSCHKCSGITRTMSTWSSSSSCGTTTRCVCSDYVTFHTKVLATNTRIEGKETSSDDQSKGPKDHLFCSWTPCGLLPPKWMDESSFKPTIRLPRFLFPSLIGQSTSMDDEDGCCSLDDSNLVNAK